VPPTLGRYAPVDTTARRRPSAVPYPVLPVYIAVPRRVLPVARH